MSGLDGPSVRALLRDAALAALDTPLALRDYATGLRADVAEAWRTFRHDRRMRGNPPRPH